MTQSPDVSPKTTSWRQHALACLAFALCTLVLAYPVFAGKFLVNPNSDQYIGGYAVRAFAAHVLQSGHGFPLWNPYILGGLPYVAAMHGDIFYPTFLLRLVMPTDLGMTWGFIIHLFLAGSFTYGFTLAWGFRYQASVFAGVAYMLAGQIASLASPGHDGKLFVSALLPLALWMLVCGIRDGRRWAWGALALVVGLGWLSPHPQMLQYMLLAAGAFAVFIAFANHDGIGRLPREVALRRLGFALGAVALGTVIAAVQFLPVMEYVPWSPRGAGHTYDFATQFSMPVEEFFNVYLPQFTGILDHYWGRNGIHLHSEYLGASILVLAGAAYGAATRRGFRWFWTGAAIVSALWAMGGATPFYQLIYAVVPGTKFFRAPSIIFFLTSFAVVMLATIGFERAIAKQISRRYLIGWLGAGGLVALLASGGMLTNVAQSVAASFAGSRLHDAVQANNGALVLGAWRSFLFVAFTCGIIWAVSQQRLRVAVAGALLIVVSAADLLSIDHEYWMFSPPASTLFASDSVIAYLNHQPQPVRVVPLALKQQDLYDPYFRGDALMIHDVRSATGYHGNELGAYEILGNKQGPTYQNEILPEFWRLTNVQYIYTDVDAPELDSLYATQLKRPDITFTRVAGPVQNSFGSTIYLLQTSQRGPYAWITPAIVKAPEDQIVPTVLDRRFNPATVAIFDTTARVNGQKLSAMPAPLSITTTVASYAPGHVAIDLTSAAPEGSALVASENYYPGWSATVDGKPVSAIGRADGSLIGVALPAGARHVELNFDDPAYETGKKYTIAAILLALILTGWGLVADRSRMHRD